MIKRREFLKKSSYLLGFLGIPALSFGKNKEQKKISNKKNISGNKIERYDDRGNLIYSKNQQGSEIWQEFDDDNNRTKRYTKWGDGFDLKYWDKFDKRGNHIYSKCKNKKADYCSEWWRKYDKNNKEIYYKNSKGCELYKKYKYNSSGKLIEKLEKIIYIV